MGAGNMDTFYEIALREEIGAPQYLSRQCSTRDREALGPHPDEAEARVRQLVPLRLEVDRGPRVRSSMAKHGLLL